MAIFSRSSRFALALLPALACAQTPSPPEPISLDAASSTFDGKNNRMLFRGLNIKQGTLSISADEASASGLDFQASEWTFRGHLRIAMDATVLTADEAHLVFSEHRLVSGALRGTPARIESTAGAEPLEGGAGQIFYDNEARTLRLSMDAWLSQGPNEIKGCDLIYDLAAERIASGSSDCGEPVRITIQPPKDGAGTNPPGPP